jgi:hypothetical protein
MTGFLPVPGIGLEGYREAVGPDRRALADHGRRSGCDDRGGARRTADPRRPHPLDPGYRDQPVDEIPGSESLVPAGSFSVGLWFQPTLLTNGWHALIAHWRRARSATACSARAAGSHGRRLARRGARRVGRRARHRPPSHLERCRRLVRHRGPHRHLPAGAPCGRAAVRLGPHADVPRLSAARLQRAAARMPGHGARARSTSRSTRTRTSPAAAVADMALLTGPEAAASSRRAP